MYKEYRDTTLNGSVEQMYTDWLHTQSEVSLHPNYQNNNNSAKLCKRESTKQFHMKDIKFPQVFQKVRPPTRKLKPPTRQLSPIK
ncbi:hypothetical protein GIB67_041905 [Kingdonia uniflora]|uniref:Uncharacterized protein n=1 Tax=Kingdonia uniflora TaxID=39325 RepID=A0A7J7ME68_9MAGN|nr:hypothetical protein GIB67_041905 [Kingdonia uniflora]